MCRPNMQTQLLGAAPHAAQSMLRARDSNCYESGQQGLVLFQQAAFAGLEGPRSEEVHPRH